MSTKSEPGPFDAFDKARDNEPLFVLLGRDPDAPATVSFWVDQRRRRILATDAEPEQVRKELQQATEAESIAWEMNRYRKGEPAQDTLLPQRATYSGEARAPDEEAQRAQMIRQAVAAIREAAYHINLASEMLTTVESVEISPEHADGFHDLSEALKLVHKADATFSPARRGVQPSLPLENATK